ncbi:MAG TPA: hypothetical protein VEC99_01985 [Clostridia bacterium]|nr:hypothetical protein [Clostridia bacterium]
MKARSLGVLFCVVLTQFCICRPVSAAVYSGNGDSSAGGAIGLGSLTLADNGTTVSATLSRGIGSFNRDLVLFIDSVAGGFASTASFNNNGTGLERAVSGLNPDGSARAIANFAAGFRADYALAIGTESGGMLYKLVESPDGMVLNPVRNVTLSPSMEVNEPNYRFSFDWTEIGLNPGTENSFKFQSSYIYSAGYRYLESFENFSSGRAGFNEVTYGNANFYGVEPVPETTTMALAVFGVVACSVGVAKRFRRRA